MHYGMLAVGQRPGAGARPVVIAGSPLTLATDTANVSTAVGSVRFKLHSPL